MNDSLIERKRITRIACIIALLLVVVMAGAHGVFAADIVDSGTCGSDLTWTLDSDGVLTIEGSGYMEDYNNYSSDPHNPPWDASLIKRVVINDGVMSIGAYAFRDCNILASITIPESISSIGKYAFSYCTSLTSITIPNGVKRLDGYAFYYCSNLKSLTIPDNAISFSYSPFFECNNLSEIHIPDVETWITFQGGAHIWGEKHLYIDGSELTSIILPENMTDIGEYAFRGCSSLTSITIPDGVSSIGEYAFEGCNSLVDVIIPDSVISIGEYAFGDCRSLIDITIPESITSIEPGVFSYCSSLVNIILPEGMTSIGSSAFSGCSSLTSITIPENVTSIGSSAFSGCSSLTSITIPENVPYIESSVFGGCTNLTIFHIPTIETWFEFQNKANIQTEKHLYIDGVELTSIVIPDDVTSIESGTFSNCISLVSITIPDNVTSIGSSAFYGCSSLRSITIPRGVSKIESSVFSGCGSLMSITMFDGITSIGWSAFSGCGNLESITIPNSVTEIVDRAFAGCYDLTVSFLGDAPTLVVSSNNRCFESSALLLIPYGNDTWTYPKWNGYRVAYRDISPEDNSTLSEEGYNNNGVIFALDESALTAVVSGFAGNESGVVIIPGRVTKDGMRYTVTSIARGAFNNRFLKQLVIGQNVESIAEDAFNRCAKFESITVDSDNKYFSADNGILYNKDKTTLIRTPQTIYNIQIPNTVTKINPYAFEGCRKLRCLIIPNTVTEIGDNILHDCPSLESLTIPFVGERLKAQTYDAQYPLGRLFASAYNYYNDEGVTKVEQYYYAYSDTPSSAVYYIPSSLRSVTVTGGSLYYGAFYNCSMIEEITLGKDVVFTGERAFYGCSSLERINVNKNNKELASDSNGVLYSKDYKTIKCYPSGKKVASYQIDSRVEAIDEFAFYNCLNLESLYVPETVTEIPTNSIAYYDLTMFVYRGSAAEAYAKAEDIAYKYIGEGKAKNVRVTSEYDLPVIANGEEKGSVIGDYDGVAGVVSDSTVNYDGTKSGLQTVTVTYDGEVIRTQAVVYDPVKEHFFDFGDVKEIQKSERGLAGMFDGNGRFLGLSEVIVLENHETVLIPNEVYEEAVEAKLMVIDANSFAPTGESVEEGL